ncbi:unnamed protein product, partial [Durusdinium trenchii]
GSSSSDLPAGSPVDDTPRAKATLVPRKEEPKADEGAAKPKPQLVKRKSFEEKAAETQARLEAKLAKFHQDQDVVCQTRTFWTLQTGRQTPMKHLQTGEHLQTARSRSVSRRRS